LHLFRICFALICAFVFASVFCFSSIFAFPAKHPAAASPLGKGLPGSSLVEGATGFSGQALCQKSVIFAAPLLQRSLSNSPARQEEKAEWGFVFIIPATLLICKHPEYFPHFYSC